MAPVKHSKQKYNIEISYGNIEDAIETMLRFTKVLDDDEDLLDIKWPPGNEDLNLCRRDTTLPFTITTVKR